MDAKKLEDAGLQGWRGRVADRVAPAIAQRTSLEVDQVRKVIGGLFVALAVFYLSKTVRELVRR
jgi:hypothetical protein